MSRSNRPFKDSQVYGWDAEPKDERPSEFVPSTGYSVLSGYYAMPDSGMHPARQRRSGTLMPLFVVVGLVIGAGVAALLGFLHLVRG
jgi:hypothetical protein